MSETDVLMIQAQLLGVAFGLIIIAVWIKTDYSRHQVVIRAVSIPILILIPVLCILLLAL